MSVTPKILGVVDFCLSVLVALFGIAIALKTLERGPWFDEFQTLTWTTDTSPREFLYLVTIREYQPILYYGLIFLAQHAGITDVALLRALNILGLPLVLLALLYARRQKAINVPQALVLWVLFTSSPIFLTFFAELRSYFLLYSASIGLSIIWYVLMKHIEENRYLSWFMIATWAAYLTIFANLHYFGTLFGGILTAALLIKLAIRRSWSQALVVAGISFAAAAPALALVAVQIHSIPENFVLWIKTTPITSVRYSLGIVRHAASNNLAAVASAVVVTFLFLKDGRKSIELRAPFMLLGMVGLFLGGLILADAIRPLVIYRYLIPAAGAVTFAVAILASACGSSVWVPALVSVNALFAQAYALYSILGIENWPPTVRAIAQLKSECATTKIFAYPPMLLQVDPVVGPKINSVIYGYYAKKFGFSYEDLRPGATVATSGPCPSVIWIEDPVQSGLNTEVEQVLHDLRISKLGDVETKRYNILGALIIVR
jgi:hypothetical protein